MAVSPRDSGILEGASEWRGNAVSQPEPLATAARSRPRPGGYRDCSLRHAATTLAVAGANARQIGGPFRIDADVPVDAEGARTILGMEAPVRGAHIERSLPGTFPAARASAVGPPSGEGRGKERSLSCVLFFWRPAAADIQRGGRQWPPSIRTRTPVSMADPSIRNDVGARALLATINAIRGAGPPGPFSSLGHRRCRARTATAPSAASTAPAGSTPGCPPVRRPTGETFT